MSRVLTTRTDFFSLGTELRIGKLKDYLETLKKQLEVITKDYEKDIEEEALKIENKHARDEFYELSGEQHWDYTKAFPRILLNSFHVMAYTLLESEIFSDV